MGQTLFSKSELGQKAWKLYKQLRPKIETPQNMGRLIVIDVESSDYEIDDQDIEAARRLQARRPGATLYALRIGYETVASFSGGMERTAALSSYDETFGMFKDDPTFDEFVKEVNKYRRSVDSKNIQVVDGAINSTFDVYQVPEELFNILFPDGTDVAYLDEVEERLKLSSIDEEMEMWGAVYRNKVDKKQLTGIHGTLHLTGSYSDKAYFPTRKENEVVNS